MTIQLGILLGITLTALVVFIGGWLRVDLVGLLVLSALALTGLVSPQEALAGFSSPAVVTIWAMFILSAGLTRTGIAHQLGQPLQRFAQGSEAVLIAVLMLAASILSALINTTTVAAILLPATMELARRSGRPPSRLLMPLALGCLLGGPFTSISTSTNILISDAMRNAGLQAFSLFDFTPITVAVVVTGTCFMVFIGRHLLPRRAPITGGDSQAISAAPYQMEAHIFTIRIPDNSPLDGRTLMESHLGSALFLTVVALQRKGVLMLSPRPQDVLQVGDVLVVHGPPDQLQQFHGSRHLRIEPLQRLDTVLCERMLMAEARISEKSALVGLTLGQSGLRREHGVQVLALHEPDGTNIKNPLLHHFAAGDRLVLQGERQALDKLVQAGLVADLRVLQALTKQFSAGEATRLLAIRVPEGSVLAGHDLVESRLGNVFGLTVVGIQRDSGMICMPAPREKILAGDLLLLQGSARDLEIMRGLEQLEIAEHDPGLLADLESQQVGVTEVLLSPRTTLAGRTLAELLFREHYGVSVLAIWRKGRALRAGLQETPLKFGDALLVYGPRSRLAAVARNPDFLVLDRAAAQTPRLERAPVAAIIMVATILSAVLGFLPIAIAAVTGASMMILLRCLSMDEAYRAIEWKVIFLIACMLPLGVAVEHTGAAQLGAEGLIAVVGGLGPRWVVAVLFFITCLGTQVIPPAALVVLMAPVALTMAESISMSPHLLMMSVAIAASSSFASPLSHPAHLLVMNPGGYRFVDYMKVGLPLTIISMLVCVWLLPILWPA